MKLLLAVLTLAFVLAGCSRQGDARARDDLAGTWVATGIYANGGSFKSTITVDRNGDYVCQVVVQSDFGVIRTADMEGKLQVRDGVLIDTMTKHSNTNAVLPRSTRARIVRINDREMVLNSESLGGQVSPTNDVVFRKVGK